jgi:hypothetical protein
MSPNDIELLKARVRARLPADATGRITYSARANARVMCGSNWYTPREFEALRERSRMHVLEGSQRRLKNDG